MTRALRDHGPWRAFVVPFGLVAVWAILAALGRGNPHLLVPPYALVSAARDLLAKAAFWADLGTSLARVVAGWALGSTVGIAIGLALGGSRLAHGTLAPSLNAVRQVALFAWIPLLTAWLGDGEAAKLTLIALAAFFPSALNAEIGSRAVSRAYHEVGRVLELDWRQTLRWIVLPGAAGAIATGLRIALTSAWIGTIGAEYLIDQGTGIGVFLATARTDGRIDLVVIAIVTLALVGLALDRLLRRVLPLPRSGDVLDGTDD
jgi:sulfonate transport system permease protein